MNDAREILIVKPSSLGDIVHTLPAAALIKQFMHLLPRSPHPAQALRQFSALARQILSRPDWVTVASHWVPDTQFNSLTQDGTERPDWVAVTSHWVPEAKPWQSNCLNKRATELSRPISVCQSAVIHAT